MKSGSVSTTWTHMDCRVQDKLLRFSYLRGDHKESVWMDHPETKPPLPTTRRTKKEDVEEEKSEKG